MDRKSIIILCVSFLLILGWFKLVEVMYPPPPPRAITRTTTGTNAPSATNAASRGETNLAAPLSTNSAAAALGATQWTAPKTAEELLVLETADVKYTFTTHGGGVKLIELKRFPKIIGNRKADDPSRVVLLNDRSPVAAMTLLGSDAVQGDGVFALAKTDTGVRAEKLLPSVVAPACT